MTARPDVGTGRGAARARPPALGPPVLGPPAPGTGPRTVPND
ncbi:MAG: hypothetical protein ACJ79S_12460 [Gemmatimonadaceae bacterium]